jgi:hypothetical protein
MAGIKTARFVSVFDGAKNQPRKSLPGTFTFTVSCPGWVGWPLLAPGFVKRSAVHMKRGKKPGV